MGLDITGLGAIFDFGSKVVDKIFPNPEDKAKAMIELEQLKQTGELAQMANETDLFKTEVDDRKSARLIHTSFVDVLAIAVLGGAGYLLTYILVHGVNKDIDSMTTGMIIQVAITAITMVLGYYFGSSSGSKAKNDAIGNMIKNKQEI